MQISTSTSIIGSPSLQATIPVSTVSSPTSQGANSTAAKGENGSTTTPTTTSSGSISLLSSGTLMAILQSENTINPDPTAAQSTAAAAYSSDPGADPQFLDVSGMTPVNMPSSTPGEKQLLGIPLSGATIAGIENQLGVKAVYVTNQAGQVDEAAGINLYDSNGNLIQYGDPRLQEFQEAIGRAVAAQKASNLDLSSLQATASTNLEAISSGTETSMSNALMSII